jgi:hypothetical protein
MNKDRVEKNKKRKKETDKFRIYSVSHFCLFSVFGVANRESHDHSQQEEENYKERRHCRFLYNWVFLRFYFLVNFLVFRLRNYRFLSHFLFRFRCNDCCTSKLRTSATRAFNKVDFQSVAIIQLLRKNRIAGR